MNIINFKFAALLLFAFIMTGCNQSKASEKDQGEYSNQSKAAEKDQGEYNYNVTYYTPEDYPEYAFIVEYLNNKYGGDYKILSCHFQHYDHGITGGMRMYDFEIEDKNGELYTASYQRYAPLNEETVENISFDKKVE